MSIPTILVSGGLGSGKTTLLKVVVAANPEHRFGIVVNEFGEMGVDGDLLRPSVPEIGEIRNGCICCATQEQLAPAIKELIRTYKIDILLVEMSGAAEPLPVIRELQVLAPLIDVRSHVVLVDGTADPDLSTRERIFQIALTAADIAVITKIDVCESEQIERWSSLLGALNRRAPLVRAARGNLPLSALIENSRREEQEWPRFSAGRHDPALHRFTSVCRFVGALTSTEIAAFVRLHGAKMARIKGIAYVDGVWSEVQVVRSDLQITSFAGVPPERGRLVFISKTLYRPELLKIVDDVFGDDGALLRQEERPAALVSA
jgi:G3E family GTPase